jgi:gas vesicle protein
MMSLLQRNTDSHRSTVLLALLAGAGAGLAVGILMAPKSGDTLRADIREAVDDYLGTARQKADDLRTSASNLVRQGLQEVRRTTKQAHDAIDDTVATVNGAAQRA